MSSPFKGAAVVGIGRTPECHGRHAVAEKGGRVVFVATAKLEAERTGEERDRCFEMDRCLLRIPGT